MDSRDKKALVEHWYEETNRLNELADDAFKKGQDHAYALGLGRGRVEAEEAAIERCAAWVDARRNAFIEEYGSTDPSTGALEFGRGEHAEVKAEYVGELEEIAAGLRALKA